MSAKSLDWEIDAAARVVHFTLTQEIVLTPIRFDMPFEFVKYLGAKATVIETEARQKALIPT